MSKVIILDGHLKSALAAVRSLGKKGVHVIGGSDRSTAMALHSRYCTEKFIYPRPVDDLRGFLDAISKAAGTDEKPLVMAFSDQTSAALSRNRDQLQGIISLELPQTQHFETAFDKSKTVELAHELEIPVPSKVSPGHSWPVVIKPKYNYAWEGNTGNSARVQIAISEKHLDEITQDIKKKIGEPVLVQEYISGKEVGFETLFWHGVCVAECAHERLRSLDPTGGASVYMHTIVAPTEVRSAALKLLQKLSWHGPAMVEFKQGADGTWYLIEINGRFWGSLPLAIYAAVDFPFLLWQAHIGKELEPQIGASEIASRYLLGDIAWLLKVFFHRSPLRQLYPKRTQALREFLKTFTLRVPDDVWSEDDGMPFLWDIIDKLRA
jgi:predicted ATP-grasp superfamily ATP-dependent carboligase